MRKPLLKPERPFDVRQWPGYYGWVILVFGTLGMVAAVPGSPPGMSVFIDGMMQSLDLSRANFSLAYTCGTIAAGLAAPFVGGWVDRLGARWMGMLSFAGLGLVLLFTGSLDRIVVPLSDFFPGTTLPFVLVFAAFAGIRLAGVSFAMTTCRSMVFRWFEGRRGWAAAINGVALSLSFSSAPILLNGLIGVLDWQRTWLALGCLFLFGMSTLAYVFFRDSPESCGVAVERGGEGGGGVRTRLPVVRDFTSREALGTTAFWIFAAGLALNALIGTGISFHLLALAEAKGLARAEAVRVFLPIAIFHIGTTLTLGVVAERVRLKYVLILMVLGQTLGLLGVANLGDPFWRWIYIVGSGVGWGCFGVLINLPWPRFFGRRHLGAINGWVTGATVITSALGPYVFGLSAQLTGSFATAILFVFLMCPAVLLAAAFADNPQRALQGGVEQAGNRRG